MPRYIGLKYRHIQHAVDAVLQVDDLSRKLAQENITLLLKEKLSIEVDHDTVLSVVDMDNMNEVVINIPSNDHLWVSDIDDDLALQKVLIMMEKECRTYESEEIVGKIPDHDDPDTSFNEYPYCPKTWEIFRPRIK